MLQDVETSIATEGETQGLRIGLELELSLGVGVRVIWLGLYG